jgi:hypothetical protein
MRTLMVAIALAGLVSRSAAQEKADVASTTATVKIDDV